MVEQKGRDGQRIGNYRLVRLLGRGGFAEVYLAEHLYLNTQAAVKLLSTQLANESVEGFRNEAQMIAGLVHPRIVRVLDFGVEDSIPYLVMDYAPHGTLRQRHPRGTRLPLPLVVSYVQQIAGALQYAHERRLIHRDVKPENMLGGSNDEVLLSDFGIALVAQSSRYQKTQNIAGTLAYMAPEQIQAHPRPASDQYALGIVVYEWLGGQRPFQGTMTEIAIKHATAVPPPLRQLAPDLPQAAEHVVLTALRKDPHDRFPTVQAFAQALEQVSKQLSQSFTLSSASTPVSGPFPSHPSVSQHPSVHTGAPTAGRTSHPGSFSSATTAEPGTPAAASHPGSFSGSTTTEPPPYPGTPAASPYPPAWTPATPAHPGSFSGSATTEPPPYPGAPAASPYPPAWTPATPHPGPIPGPTTSAWQTPNQFTHTWQSGQPSLPAQGRRFSRRAAISALAGGAAAVGSVVAYTAFISSRNGPSSPQGQPGPHATYPGATPTSATNTTPTTSTPALMTFSDHPKTIWAVSWSPDGKYIASASDDGTSHVWNVASRQRVFSYHSGIQPAQSDDGAYSVAWLPNSTGIAVGFGDGTAQIVNLAARRQIGTYDSTTGGDLSGHLYAVAISPNSRYIALAGFFSDDVQIFDIGTQRRVRALVGHTDSVWSLAWSHNGRYLASGSADTTARVWDWQSGKLLLIYDKQGDDVRTVSWSPDDTRIASSGLSGPVYIWTSDTGQTQLIYGTQADFEILAAAWSPDGRYIASAGGSDATTHVWNARNGQLLRAFPASAINSVSWSPDSAHLVTANNSVVQVWQL
ncbi:MAG TPA: protein kinase [Ktedonobacteraceae bacterium]